MTFAGSDGDHGNSGGADDEENFSNLSGDDDLGEYFDGKTLIVFDDEDDLQDNTCVHLSALTCEGIAPP